VTDASATVQLLATTGLQWTWDVVTPINPTRFYPRFGPLPAVVGVRDQTGPWSTVGQTRTLQLSDGGTVQEELTTVDQPDLFAYRLTNFSKVFGRLVDHARAEWRFEQKPGGTLVSWTYTFVAKPRRAWLVGLVVRLAWEPYMRRVLPEIVHEAERLA
jgi:hypothetical protein